jgi:hypothetical protein
MATLCQKSMLCSTVCTVSEPSCNVLSRFPCYVISLPLLFILFKTVLQFLTLQRCTKLSHTYSVSFSLLFKLMRCQGYYKLSFTFPASTAPFFHVTWFTQFRDYRHDGHMFECPVPHLHLSISSFVSDAQIFLMNKLFCSFSLACASCDLDA